VKPLPISSKTTRFPQLSHNISRLIEKHCESSRIPRLLPSGCCKTRRSLTSGSSDHLLWRAVHELAKDFEVPFDFVALVVKTCYFKMSCCFTKLNVCRWRTTLIHRAARRNQIARPMSVTMRAPRLPVPPERVRKIRRSRFILSALSCR
jgi:hypothetical protein